LVFIIRVLIRTDRRLDMSAVRSFRTWQTRLCPHVGSLVTLKSIRLGALGAQWWLRFASSQTLWHSAISFHDAVQHHWML